MPQMRAKFVLRTVERGVGTDRLAFKAVARGTYPDSGDDENNTYANFTPQADCEIVVANPALVGKFEPGTEFYVYFMPADEIDKPPQQPAA
jgi:hypothetical protein